MVENDWYVFDQKIKNTGFFQFINKCTVVMKNKSPQQNNLFNMFLNSRTCTFVCTCL